MRLVLPDVHYKESFLEALHEYEQDPKGEFYRSHQRAFQTDFGKYTAILRSQSRGENLPPTFVPQTTYWLIEDTIYIGTVSIRHTLTPFLLKIAGHIGYNIRPSERHKGYGKKILELALSKAKELGITNALVTCDETNIPSKKIIEANGGVFENSVPQEGGLPNKLRYWIRL